MASNSCLSLAPASRPACGVLTIDTTATPPEPTDGLGVAHGAGWKRRSNCPSVTALQSISSSSSFPVEADLPGSMARATHHVANHSRILDAHFARQAKYLTRLTRCVKSECLIDRRLERSIAPG